MPCSGRKHTPIVSEKQRGLFGHWLSNPKSRPSSISKSEVKSHLEETKGKSLPEKMNEIMKKKKKKK